MQNFYFVFILLKINQLLCFNKVFMINTRYISSELSTLARNIGIFP